MYTLYESLDSVINVLKEYEEYLDELVTRFRKITGKLENVEYTEEFPKKIKKVEKRLSVIEAKISSFLSHITSEKKLISPYSKLLVVRCKNWQEFKTFSVNAELISFLVEDSESFFQVTSLKDGKILTYSGEIPDYTKLLKAWISRELSIENQKVVEGVLSLER